MARGLGAFTVAGHSVDCETVLAIEASEPAALAHRALHGETYPRKQADVLLPSTLLVAAHAAPAIIALSFPGRPWTAPEFHGDFASETSHLLTALLAYVAVLRPRAIALESLAAFAGGTGQVSERGLRGALMALQPQYHMLVETTNLREIRPIDRDSWLALCSRWEEWSLIPPQVQRTIVEARWTPVHTTLQAVGIPWEREDRTDLLLPSTLLLKYKAPSYLPLDFHSRFMEDWTELPAWTHVSGSDFFPCPCGCRPRALADNRVQAHGATTLLVRTGNGARLPAPEEIAQVLGFPARLNWRALPPRLALVLLGSSVSPLRTTRVLSRLAMYVWDCEGAARPPRRPDPSQRNRGTSRRGRRADSRTTGHQAAVYKHERDI